MNDLIFEHNFNFESKLYYFVTSYYYKVTILAHEAKIELELERVKLVEYNTIEYR